MGENRNACRILMGTPEGKRSLGRLRHKWMDSIKSYFREIGWDGVGWIDVGHDRDQWRALVNTNESSGSMKCWDVLEWLHNWRLLKTAQLRE
jgi:hypothetical protein